MPYWRITLHRSAIGLPKRTKGVLAALGLHKRCQVVFKPVHPQFAGMIMKVKELVKVEEVDRPKTKRELQDERKPDPGFVVEKRGSEMRGALPWAREVGEGEVRL
ncbi:mitochondrial 54S ribosomal protein uL30m [Thermochaetoides thermophila DSM 1495]|uniref:Large ribosomal subunit protein uL30m n=1 Tax=Chaetomium thermophilum (strain DSM 1495 / CBS 144.50 / IMI 039719) TaxID=759272 RepID=G0S245_CHATD|nr:putative ribosomal protein [Thermochaetoides thermophila DSM 1495]EGS23105.1 putative ribosomal protein [Thermochaetoides thermophila DSM 1495]